MSKPQGIIVFGANGSGKSTLGLELARNLRFKHMDIEDYHFVKSEIPYTKQRSREECLNLMLNDIQKHGSFVISAVTGNFGNEISSMYKLAVFARAPLETRIRRIEKREYERHGKRILKGGDMYDQHLEFLDFAAARSVSKIEHWAETLTCPVVCIDTTEDWRKDTAAIAKRFYSENALLKTIPDE